MYLLHRKFNFIPFWSVEEKIKYNSIHHCIFLTRSLEWIFKPMRYTDFLFIDHSSIRSMVTATCY